MTRLPAVKLVLSRKRSELGSTCKTVHYTCLWRIACPSGQDFYFLTVSRTTGLDVELETSPVLGTSESLALDIFHRIHSAPGGVAPYHLTDIVQDLLTEYPVQNTNDIRHGWFAAESSG